jgi:DNA-binding response OmpR family regulator
MTAAVKNGSEPTVLVADDDPDILSLVTVRLKRAGYAVITADDGRKALDAVRDHRPEVAIVDMRMPEMDGIDVIRQIRADERSKDMLVIALSARVQEANIAEGLEAGADEYLEKPFKGSQLLELVETKLPTVPAASPESPS